MSGAGEETIKVTIKRFSAEDDLTLNVSPQGSIKLLKECIHEQLGIAPYLQQLVTVVSPEERRGKQRLPRPQETRTRQRLHPRCRRNLLEQFLFYVFSLNSALISIYA